MDNLKIRASQIGRIMTASRSKSEVLSQTAKSYIQELALENLYKTLSKYRIGHGNIKVHNCFLKLNSDHEGNKLSIVVSDPHLDMMFEDPTPDSESIADIIHVLICGRRPIKIPDYKRMIH